MARKGEAESRCASLIFPADSPCRFCGKETLQPRRHLTHCGVLSQASLAGLLAQAQNGDSGRSGPGDGSAPGDAGGLGSAAVGEAPDSGPANDGSVRAGTGREGGATREGGRRGRTSEEVAPGRQQRQGPLWRFLVEKVETWKSLRKLEPELGPVERHGLGGDGVGARCQHPGAGAVYGQDDHPSRAGAQGPPGYRLCDVRRYLGPRLPGDASTGFSDLAGQVCQRSGPHRAEDDHGPVAGARPQGENGSYPRARGETSEMQAGRVDGRDGKRLEPQLGLSHLGPGSQKAGGRDGACTLETRGVSENDRRPCRELAEGRGADEVLLSEGASGELRRGGDPCHRALKTVSGCAVTKLQGIRLQKPPLARALETAFMATPMCDWSRRGNRGA